MKAKTITLIIYVCCSILGGIMIAADIEVQKQKKKKVQSQSPCTVKDFTAASMTGVVFLAVGGLFAGISIYMHWKKSSNSLKCTEAKCLLFGEPQSNDQWKSWLDQAAKACGEDSAALDKQIKEYTK